MTPKAYEQFKQNIKDKGLQDKLTVNQDYVLLNGHHRYRALKELGIPITENDIEIKHFDDPLEEKEYVHIINLLRRHLTPFQYSEEISKLEEIEIEKATQRQKAGKKISLSSNELEVGQARDIAIKKYGGIISPTTYTRAKKVMKCGTEEVKQRLREDKGEINTEYRALQSKEKRQKLIEEAANSPTIKLPEGTKLIHGDFREVCKNIPDNSIDLIFTDPPYDKESLPIYKDLAKVAERILKEGGSLVTYIGEYALDEIIVDIKNAGLKFWYQIIVELGGQHQLLFGHGVYVLAKPLLWFVKGSRRAEPRKTFPNLVKSQPPDKGLHDKDWDQSPVEAEHVIDGCTVENQIVLDPMMGSGTTGIATLNLKRKFIGIEIDKDRFEIAKANISKFQASLDKEDA